VLAVARTGTVPAPSVEMGLILPAVGIVMTIGAPVEPVRSA
jgi:hypothetical protein